MHAHTQGNALVGCHLVDFCSDARVGLTFIPTWAALDAGCANPLAYLLLSLLPSPVHSFRNRRRNAKSTSAAWPGTTTVSRTVTARPKPVSAT